MTIPVISNTESRGNHQQIIDPVPKFLLVKFRMYKKNLVQFAALHSLT